jgi:hypothetical protein
MAKTRTEILSYGKAQNIEADGCYSISFYRPTGSNPVNVNGFDLEEGQSLAIQQNVGDEDWSTYDIVFYTGAGSNAIQVVKIMPE